MTRQESAYAKAQRLMAEVQQLKTYANNCNDEIYELAELYMDNRIHGDVGKEQKRLRKLADKYLNEASKKEAEIMRLRRKYNF